MTLKSNTRLEEFYREPVLCQKKEFKSSLMKIFDTSSNMSLRTIDGCSNSTSEDDCHFHKRRKIDGSMFLPTNGNMKDSPTTNFTSFGDDSSMVQNGDGISLTVPLSVEPSNFGADVAEYTYAAEYKQHIKTTIGSVGSNSLGLHSSVDGRLTPSSSSMASYINQKIKDDGKCSSPDENSKKSITELSARDLCISILKREMVLTKESEQSSMSTHIVPDDDKSNHLFACKSCGIMEDPLNMLICDCCEGAFHLSCCYRRIKKIPNNRWYCHGCSRKKHKRRLENWLNQDGSSENIHRPRRGLGPISDMLLGVEPYETKVRIGRDFQAEVSEWSGLICSSEDHFDEPSELDPAEMTILGLPQVCKNKKASIGHWIQCQDVLDTGVVCSKWRRAPLFVVQSSNWDCSCSVIWDPIHADCAVPQELDTDEVLKQLKYTNKLKNRLANHKQKH